MLENAIVSAISGVLTYLAFHFVTKLWKKRFPAEQSQETSIDPQQKEKESMMSNIATEMEYGEVVDVSYDRTTLVIAFKSGITARFFGVHESLFAELKNSSSLTDFCKKHIYGKYRCSP